MHIKTLLVFLPLGLVMAFALTSCRKSAGSTKEASEILTSSRGWSIVEISVNDAVTFKDGKMKPQFGGIEFDRYMETVKFENDGTFMGYFKGETKPMELRWLLKSDQIAVTAADTASRGGEWTIIPADVADDYFMMKTQSTAYDFPRMTKITLKFKSQQ
jgi:hypothetical protein